MVISHYAGSIAYDNEDGEMVDTVLTAMDRETLIEKLTEFKARRENSDVFFACIKIGKKEIDITEEVKNAIRMDQ